MNLKNECETDLNFIAEQGKNLNEKYKEKEKFFDKQKLELETFSKEIFIEKNRENQKKINQIKEKITKTLKLIDKLSEIPENQKKNSCDVLDINEKIVLSNKLKKLQEKLAFYEKNFNFSSEFDKKNPPKNFEISQKKPEKELNFQYNQLKLLKEKLIENELLEKDLILKLENVEKELKKVLFEKEKAEENVEKLFSQEKNSSFSPHKKNPSFSPEKKTFLSPESEKKPSVSVQTEEKSKGNPLLSPNKEEYLSFYEEIEGLYRRISRYLKKKESSDVFLPKTNDLSSQKVDSFEIFRFFKEILAYFLQKEERIRVFEREKEKFLEDFERETCELTENWRNFDKKKLEYKEKLSEEKALLYKELDEEYKKISDFKSKIRFSAKKTPKKLDPKENSKENSFEFEKNEEKDLKMQEKDLMLSEKIAEKQRSLEIIEKSLKQ